MTKSFLVITQASMLSQPRYSEQTFNHQKHFHLFLLSMCLRNHPQHRISAPLPLLLVVLILNDVVSLE